MLGQIHLHAVQHAALFLLGLEQLLVQIHDLVALTFGLAPLLVGLLFFFAGLSSVLFGFVLLIERSTFVNLGLRLGLSCTDRLPRARNQSEHQGRDDEGAGGKCRPVPPRKPPEAVAYRWWAGLNGLISQIALQIS